MRMTPEAAFEHQRRVAKGKVKPEMVNVGAKDSIPPKIRMVGKDSEKELHCMIADYLSAHHGIIVGHARMDKKSTFTEHWPDFTFSVSGQACAIELKREGEDATDDQKKCHDAMRQNGWEVAVCDSFDKVVEFLKGIKFEQSEANKANRQARERL